MAHKLKLRDLGMDTMERLYYERKEARQKAYATKKRKKPATKKETVPKKARKEHNTSVMIFEKAI